MYKNISYRTLATMLKTLGFKEKKVKGAHIIFSNPEFNALIILPYYTANRMITPPHFSMIKRTITEKGILSEEEFYDAFHPEEEKVLS